MLPILEEKEMAKYPVWRLLTLPAIHDSFMPNLDSSIPVVSTVE
jgi:hypothetical protein